MRALLDSLDEDIEANAPLVVKHLSQEDKTGQIMGAAIILKGRYTAQVLDEIDGLIQEIVDDINKERAEGLNEDDENQTE